MTGYGSRTISLAAGDEQESTGSLTIEIRSVNLRFLDVKVRQPFGMVWERKLRKQVTDRLGRGRVELHVNLQRAPQSAELEQLAHALDAVALTHQIAGEKKVELASFNALELLRFAGSKTASNGPEEVPEELVASVTAVVEELVAMRRAEGEALAGVLGTLANELEQEVAAIEAELPGEDVRLLGRAREHLAVLFGERETSDPEANARFQERLLSEVALLIHKGDVAEELARIASHLCQWREVLGAPAKVGQGKTLDFLCQELFREVTTIGSKVTAHGGSRRVIAAKGIVERMREQVQNVE